MYVYDESKCEWRYWEVSFRNLAKKRRQHALLLTPMNGNWTENGTAYRRHQPLKRLFRRAAIDHAPLRYSCIVYVESCICMPTSSAVFNDTETPEFGSADGQQGGSSEVVHLEIRQVRQ